jgi:hypothetical protein
MMVLLNYSEGYSDSTNSFLIIVRREDAKNCECSGTAKNDFMILRDPKLVRSKSHDPWACYFWNDVIMLFLDWVL